MTKEIERQIPKLGETDGQPMGERRVYAKYFHCLSNWTWYAFEYDAETGEFFGLVDGHEKELGYFTLQELQGVKVHGLPIERDLYFGTPLVKECKELAGWYADWVASEERLKVA